MNYEIVVVVFWKVNNRLRSPDICRAQKNGGKMTITFYQLESCRCFYIKQLHFVVLEKKKQLLKPGADEKELLKNVVRFFLEPGTCSAIANKFQPKKSKMIHFKRIHCLKKKTDIQK